MVAEVCVNECKILAGVGGHNTDCDSLYLYWRYLFLAFLLSVTNTVMKTPVFKHSLNCVSRVALLATGANRPRHTIWILPEVIPS